MLLIDNNLEDTTSMSIGIAKDEKNSVTEKVNNKDIYQRAINYSTVSCPFCERKFAPRCAERHIPICKNILNRAKKI